MRPFLYFISLFSLTVLPSLSKAATYTAKAAEPVNSYMGGSFACILADETYFYETESARSGLFILPKTYFVKVLEEGETFCRVEYLTNENGAKKLTGYCKKEQLTFVDYVPKHPYLQTTVNVTYTIDGVKGDPFLTEITLTCVYYGTYRVGSETYCYVLREDEFGYVPLPVVFSYPDNPEYYENLVEEEPSKPTVSTPSSGSSPVQTAILVLLCVLVPVLAALVLRAPRRPPYDREE